MERMRERDWGKGKGILRMQTDNGIRTMKWKNRRGRPGKDLEEGGSTSWMRFKSCG